MPFVPSIDLQLFKESVRPLLQPELMPVNILHDATAWLVVGYLLRCMRNDLRLDGVLPALILVVFALEIVIIDNALHASNLVGGLLAVAIWPAMTRIRMRPESVLVALLLLTVTLSGLAPFAAAERPSAFQWMPFYGFLGGSMYLNALSAAEKVFLYGSMVFLLQRFTVTRTFGVALVFFSVFAIELMQTRLDGHTPEITDPLLVLLAAAALRTLEKERSPSLQHPASRETMRRGAQRTIGKQNTVPPHARGAWVQQSVNLHGDQLRFVEQLSREMDVSVSRSIRHIVNNVIEDYRLVPLASARDPNAGPWLEILHGRQNRTGRISGRSAWARVTVNLKGSQFETLKGAATTLGISTSRLIRRMVGHFIDELGQERDVAAAPSPDSSAPSDPAPS
jgi:hypothetical protein